MIWRKKWVGLDLFIHVYVHVSCNLGIIEAYDKRKTRFRCGTARNTADETRVSHTYQSGSCGRPWYDQLLGVFVKQLIISGYETERKMVFNNLNS